MSDGANLEDRLRAAVGRKSDDFEPSADLADRIDARVRRHRRRRHLVQGGLVSAAAVAVAVVALVGLDRNDDGPVRTDDSDLSTRPPSTSTSSPTSGTSPSTTPSTSTTSSTTTPTTTTVVPAPGSGLDILTNLTRRGIGPIVAGMTVREAQGVGVTLTPAPVGDGSCLEAPLDLGGTVLVIEAAGADPMDGIIRATAGGVIPSEDGPMVGQTRAELLAGVGPPTRTEPGPPDLGGEVLVFEEGGYAYGALVFDDLVVGLQTGDPAWVTDPDGCPD
jgi:hypothetical protein